MSNLIYWVWRSLIEIEGSGPSLLLPVMAAKRKVSCKSLCMFAISCVSNMICLTNVHVWLHWNRQPWHVQTLPCGVMSSNFQASLEASLGQCDNFPQKTNSNPICTNSWHKVILLGKSNPTCKNKTKILGNTHFLDNVFKQKKKIPLTKNLQITK